VFVALNRLDPVSKRIVRDFLMLSPEQQANLLRLFEVTDVNDEQETEKAVAHLTGKTEKAGV